MDEPRRRDESCVRPDADSPKRGSVINNVRYHATYPGCLGNAVLIGCPLIQQAPDLPPLPLLVCYLSKTLNVRRMCLWLLCFVDSSRSRQRGRPTETFSSCLYVRCRACCMRTRPCLQHCGSEPPLTCARGIEHSGLNLPDGANWMLAGLAETAQVNGSLQHVSRASITTFIECLGQEIKYVPNLAFFFFFWRARAGLWCDV